MKYLTTKEAMQALLEGKKIIHKGSFLGDYEFLDDSGKLVYKNGDDADFEKNGYILYEEISGLKKDPYIGKQARFKSDPEICNLIIASAVMTESREILYKMLEDNTYHSIENIKERYYIEGIDF